MTTIEQSQSALYDFKLSLVEGRALANGNIRFYAKLDYYFQNNTYTDVLEGHIDNNHYSGTRLRFFDGEVLTSDLVHLDLDPKYLTFEYTNQKLIVIGNSSKLGNYTVEIKEVY